ncbi:MAG: acyloxyacyl hydrolase [Bacteroidales bacterium]
MNLNKAFLYFVAALLNLATLQAGDTIKNPLYIAVKPQYGFIIPHSVSIRDISTTNPYGLEVETGWHLVQQRSWNKFNTYSRAGFSLNYSNFDNPDVLGSSWNLLAFAEPYIFHKRQIRMSLRMGAGISYITNVYHENNNPDNLFFSSPLSFMVNADLNILKYIDKQWFVSAYFKYNHISNGGISKPNKGMNYPTYGLGVGYSFEPVAFKDWEKKTLTSAEKKVQYSLHAFATLTEVDDQDFEGRKPAFGVLLSSRKRVSVIHAFTLGLEGLVDYKVKELMNDEPEPRDHHQFSMLVGHDFVVGDFVFSQYWGTYIYAPYYLDRAFFQRYSLTYRILPQLHAGVTLKAHAQVAENFNVLVSYDLRK